MSTCGCLENPALCTCDSDSPNGASSNKMSCDGACAPSFMKSTKQPNPDFYALMDIFYYIVGSVA